MKRTINYPNAYEDLQWFTFPSHFLVLLKNSVALEADFLGKDLITVKHNFKTLSS